MNVTEAVRTRLDVREYSDEPVPPEVRREILEAGRLASSGRNLQHWRFVLVDGDRLAELADLSPTGSWVAGADFGVAVCTDPSLAYNGLDAGRALTNMQLVAWEHGVVSGVYTVDRPGVDEFLGIPDDRELTVVAGFGHPRREIRGRKDRKPLSAVAARGTYDGELDL